MNYLDIHLNIPTNFLLENEKVITITNDYGTEFRRPETLKFPVYYCDPHKPQQSGSVENVIGSLRKFMKRIEGFINNTPRRCWTIELLLRSIIKKQVALII